MQQAAPGGRVEVTWEGRQLAGTISALQPGFAQIRWDDVAAGSSWVPLQHVRLMGPPGPPSSQQLIAGAPAPPSSSQQVYAAPPPSGPPPAAATSSQQRAFVAPPSSSRMVQPPPSSQRLGPARPPIQKIRQPAPAAPAPAPVTATAPAFAPAIPGVPRLDDARDAAIESTELVIPAAKEIEALRLEIRSLRAQLEQATAAHKQLDDVNAVLRVENERMTSQVEQLSATARAFEGVDDEVLAALKTLAKRASGRGDESAATLGQLGPPVSPALLGVDSAQPQPAFAPAQPMPPMQPMPALGVADAPGGPAAAPQPRAQQAPSERLLWLLAASAFVVLFQAYMLAPILPTLATKFGVKVETIGYIIPAYLWPFGVSSLFLGPLGDRVGRRRVLLTSLFLLGVALFASILARTLPQLIIARALAGFFACGVVPLSLAQIGMTYPYEKRGRPLGLVYGAMAGGMAFGSTVGAVAEEYIGWRGLLVGVGAITFLLAFLMMPVANRLGDVPPQMRMSVSKQFFGYGSLIGTARGGRSYLYVFLNAIFHSGTFTWFGAYFHDRYGMGDFGIGLALLGYGVPGFLFGPLVGRMADKLGRGRLIPVGLAIGAISALALAPTVPLWVAAIAVTTVSLGYDMTQPLFTAIATSLDPKRIGQAIGLNAFALFVGYGVGSVIFAQAMHKSMGFALYLFGAGELLIGILAFVIFRKEVPPPKPPA
ncbi:MAG: transporter [Labilithrix sp.]|nr:transporter [Labilithrix sp.]